MAMFNSNVGLPEGTQPISSCNEQEKTLICLTILPSLFLILQEILSHVNVNRSFHPFSQQVAVDRAPGTTEALSTPHDWHDWQLLLPI